PDTCSPTIGASIARCRWPPCRTSRTTSTRRCSPSPTTVYAARWPGSHPATGASCSSSRGTASAATTSPRCSVWVAAARTPLSPAPARACATPGRRPTTRRPSGRKEPAREDTGRVSERARPEEAVMNTEDEAFERLAAADPAAGPEPRPGALRAKVAALADGPTHAPPSGSDEVAARRARRTPWLVAAGVAGAVALGGGGYALGVAGSD